MRKRQPTAASDSPRWTTARRFRVGDQWLVITTDSHVVTPPFLPRRRHRPPCGLGHGERPGDDGRDRVAALTCAVILEEGFPRADLERIQASMRAACEEARHPIVTGDTKVMGRGEIDGIVLNTTGVAFTRRVVPDCGLATRATGSS